MTHPQWGAAQLLSLFGLSFLAYFQRHPALVICWCCPQLQAGPAPDLIPNIVIASYHPCPLRILQLLYLCLD